MVQPNELQRRGTMLKNKRLWLAGLLLAAFTSCIGPNHAVGHVYKWNAEIGNRWGRSVVFVLALPVYAIFSIGDVLIFNSIYWWTGNNPISDPAAHINMLQVGDSPEMDATREEVSR
jgi:hypothetical protein